VAEQGNNRPNHYTADDIQVLEGLEAVRRRPGMYIGGTDIKALHHMVYEVVDNSIDEAMAGYCDRIAVTIHKDGSVTVQDWGRGIPVGIHKQTGKSALEVVMTKLHAGGKFGGGATRCPAACTASASRRSTPCPSGWKSRCARDGKLHASAISAASPRPTSRSSGRRPEKPARARPSMPDRTIFEETDFRFETLVQRFREMAFLNARL
jgi:DNA gyrase subunit B